LNNKEAHMKRLITPIALISLLVCAGVALAHGPTVRVSGTQGPLDTAAGSPGDPCAMVDPATGQAPILSNAMAGSLIGCWYTDTVKLVTLTPRGVIHTTGTEHFVGCLDIHPKQGCTHADPTGTLALSYKFEAKLDPVTGNEMWGRCQHRIMSGTGGFHGAAGRIDFKDNVTNGTSTYRGHITLDDRHGTARATAAAAAARPWSMC
jgi:hypothetical protein